MKAFLQMLDDGISSEIWLQYARAYLEAGRTVVAVLSAARVHDGVIGTGDELPSVHAQPWAANEQFSIKGLAAGENASAFMGYIRNLPDDVVLMWDVSPVDKNIFGDNWSMVLAECRDSVCDMVFTCRSPSYSRRYEGTAWIANMTWDHAAGSRLVRLSQSTSFFDLFPTLTANVDSYEFIQCKESGWSSLWESVWRDGRLELAGTRNSILANVRRVNATPLASTRPVTKKRGLSVRQRLQSALSAVF